MARDKSVKIRLTELEDKFISEQSEKLDISRSEYMRRLLSKAMDNNNNSK